MAMLVNAVTPRVEYTATSGQTVFTVPFEWLDDDDLEVYVEGVEADFTATGAGVTGGGSITLDTGAVLADTVVILRNTEIQRLTDFPTSGPFDIEQLNLELDNITMILQELREFDGRVLALDATTAEDEASWDAQGRRIINVGDATDSKDAINKDMAILLAEIAALELGGGEGGGGGGGGDGYTTVQIDYLLQTLETDLTALITTTVNATVATEVAEALSTSYRIREIATFTGPGTLAIPDWCVAYRFIGCGGGAGGGYADGEGVGEIGAGNGGGGAATAVSPFIEKGSATTFTVTIGAAGVGGIASSTTVATHGGTTTITDGTNTLTAAGGRAAGSSGSTTVDSRASSSPGLGGYVCTGHHYVIPGHHGGRGVIFGVAGNGFGGEGGNSFFGRGGASNDDNQSGYGGNGYGAGGGGGFSVGTSNRNGGAGTPGLALIEMYE